LQRHAAVDLRSRQAGKIPDWQLGLIPFSASLSRVGVILLIVVGQTATNSSKGNNQSAPAPMIVFKFTRVGIKLLSRTLPKKK